jgi:hypothetical protein
MVLSRARRAPLRSAIAEGWASPQVAPLRPASPALRARPRLAALPAVSLILFQKNSNISKNVVTFCKMLKKSQMKPTFLKIFEKK